MPSVGNLFEQEPDHWALRGDQFLWRELGQTLAETALPENRILLERILENAFYDATGHSLSFCNEILVPRLAKEELTRGGVSGAMWRYRYFPVVLQRFDQALRG